MSLRGELPISTFFSSLILLLALPCWGAAYLDHANLQHGGEIGFASAGLGKFITPRYSLGLMYGVVPRDIADAPSIETVTIRQTYRFYDYDRLTFYGGLNIYHVLGVKFQSSKFGDPPRNYYPIGSLRALLNLGLSVFTDKMRQLSFYVESGINDVWIVNYGANEEGVNPLEHLSLAIGWRKDF